jgi:protein-tyrosine phosphatase
VVTELGVLQRQGPVFLHCVAGVERSPLVAMAWLVKRHGLGWQAALEYVQQCHPGTSPLPEQLASLRRCRWLPLSTPEPLATIPAVA